jgi:hypothetical protein
MKTFCSVKEAKPEGHLQYESIYMKHPEAKSTKTESVLVVARGWEEGRMGLWPLMGIGCSFRTGKMFWSGGEGFTFMYIY